MHRNEYYIWLSEALGAGGSRVKELFEYFGDIHNIYSASRNDYLDAGIKDGTEKLKALCRKELSGAQSILKYCRENHVSILPYEDSLYPQSFKATKNPPVMLYCKGRMVDFNDNVCIGMVGSRSCTTSGLATAYGISYKCAESGIIIVSGLAEGIDTACMRGALDAGGYTVGFIASGIDVVFPKSNKELYARTVENGLLMTEYAPKTRPLRMHFIQRNRLIAALSQGTVMYEGSMKSGAMSTVKYAMEYGKVIYSMPGSITAGTSEAPNYLIKNGAKILTESRDIIEDYLYLYPHRLSVPDSRHISKRVLVPSDLLKQSKVTQNKRLTNVPIDDNIIYINSSPTHAERDNIKAPAEIPEPMPEPLAAHEIYDTQSPETQKLQRAANEAVPKRTGKFKDRADAHAFSEFIIEQETLPVPILSESVIAMVGEDGVRIFNLIAQKKACTCDELVAATGMDVGIILTTITLLEAAAVIEQKPGGILEVR